MQRKHRVLVIDPCLVRPEVEAYNSIADIICTFNRQIPGFSFDGMLLNLPCLAPQDIEDLCAQYKVSSVIILGSYANVTDNLPWINALGQKVNELFLTRSVPLLAICFGHQLLGHLAGFRVDFVSQRHSVVSRFNDFRQVAVCHPLLRLLLSNIYNSKGELCLKMFRVFQLVVNICAKFSQSEWQKVTQCFALIEPFLPLVCEKDFAQLVAHQGKEYAVAAFVQSVSPTDFVAHARHEQEIVQINKENHGWLLAAASQQCGVEAMVHASGRAFTLQTHPETYHEFEHGLRIIKNFVLFSCLISRLDISANPVI